VNAGERLSMVFDWPSRHPVHIAVPAMMIVSVLLHAVGLFVFQLKPPSEPTSTRRTASVFFLSPTALDTGKILPIIASADPSLFSATMSEDPDIWLLPGSDYSPSFDGTRPEFLPLPAENQNAPAKLQSFNSVHGANPQNKRPAVISRPLPSKIVLEGGHAGMDFEMAPGISFAAPERKNLSPMEFLIASDPDGRVRHAFPLSSSGDEQIDRAALRALVGGHVKKPPSSPHELLWGRAVFLWGADVQRITTP